MLPFFIISFLSAHTDVCILYKVVKVYQAFFRSINIILSIRILSMYSQLTLKPPWQEKGLIMQEHKFLGT